MANESTQVLEHNTEIDVEELSKVDVTEFCSEEDLAEIEAIWGITEEKLATNEVDADSEKEIFEEVVTDVKATIEELKLTDGDYKFPILASGDYVVYAEEYYAGTAESLEDIEASEKKVFGDIKKFDVELENALNDIQDIKMAKHFYRQYELLKQQARKTEELAEKFYNKAQFFIFGDSEFSSLERFAGNQVSPKDLIIHGIPNHGLDTLIAHAFYTNMYHMFNDSRFTKRGRSLYAADGTTPFILYAAESQNGYFVTDDFIFWLAKQDSWKDIAEGKFEKEIEKFLRD